MASILNSSALAFLYSRFSTQMQEDGASLKRQTELAERFCNQHKLTLDQSMVFHDAGVSAYRGKNAEQGALAAFLTAFDEAKIPKGSYLLVENFDRISRNQPRDARTLVESILDRGINIVTLTDQRIYDSSSPNDLESCIMMLFHMNRAHEESKLKAKRVAQGWDNAKEEKITEGFKLSKHCPAWLTLNEDRKSYTVNEDRADIIRRIHAMRHNGDGIGLIRDTLNRESVPTFRGKAWGNTTVRRLLTDPYVIGTYTSHKRIHDEATGKIRRVPDGRLYEDYFPAIISKATYYQTLETFDLKTVKKGRKAGFKNLFRGLMFCDCCGSRILIASKGSKRPARVQCSVSAVKGNCNQKSRDYHLLEDKLIKILSIIDYSALFNTIDPAAKDELYEMKLELKGLPPKINNILDSIEAGNDSTGMLNQRLAELGQRQSQLKRDIASKEAMQAISVDYSIIQNAYKQFTDGELKDPTYRSRYNQLLYKAITGIKLDINNLTATICFKARFNIKVDVSKPIDGEHADFMLAYFHCLLNNFKGILDKAAAIETPAGLCVSENWYEGMTYIME